MTTKFQKALRDGKGLSIVEFVRQLRNGDYSKWEKDQRLPSGLDRVDLDARPVGAHGAIFKNYDYAQDLDIKTQTPGMGFYRYLSDIKSVDEFVLKRRARMMALYKIITENNL